MATEIQPLTEPSPGEAPGDRLLPGRWFAGGLVALTILGALLRLWYADAALFSGTGGDPMWYHLIANRIAEGLGYTHPGPGEMIGDPTAFHPPLFSLLLSAGSLVGLRSFDAHQALGCLIGALTVPVIGLVGRRAGGQLTGLITAALAAASLPLIADSGSLFSEGLYTLMISVVLLFALRLLADRSPLNSALLSASVMLATLTKSEAVPLLLLVGALTLTGGRGRWRRTAAAAGAALLVLAPWSLYSTLQFSRPVVLSTNLGSVLAGANCDQTYQGDLKGSWSLFCLLEGSNPALDEAEQSQVWTAEARRYALDHVRDWPSVALARVLRTAGVWDPQGTVRLDRFTFAVPARLGWPLLAWMWVTLPLAAAGAMVLYRRAPQITWVLLSPVMLAVVMSAVTYGGTRFRAVAEPSLTVLSVIALVWAMGRIAARLPPGQRKETVQRQARSE